MINKVNITNIKTNNIKILNKDKCIELLKEYQNGNKTVKDEIVMGNLKLVLTVIKKVNYSYNVDPDDLFQIGCIGLIKSIDNFNTSLNVAFSTYAIPMISGEIKRYLRDNNNVKISRQIKDLAYKILKYKEKYLIEHNKEPSSFEIAKYLNEDVYKIDEAIKSLNCVVSLQDTLTNDDTDELTYLDHISEDFNIEEKIINKNTLKQGISMLDDIQKNIIIKRYYKGLTQEEIAKELFISQAQVSRLEKNAIISLKKLF
ncbi:MAG: sigma-70 family RNA polymerase sigma factor [Candidatus Caccosoma sp.]|nr:sigma-70 family RNA polymerase sigma factor [Candidatus Caccosoma sp.]